MAMMTVLRMPVTGLLLDELCGLFTNDVMQENGQYKGVRLASGQNIFSHRLLLDSFFVAPPFPLPVPELQHEDSNQVDVCEALIPVQKVVRATYITRFVLYLSTLCDDPLEGKKSLHAAMNALCRVPAAENYENNISVENESVKAEPEETILWSAMYVQELVEFWEIFSTDGSNKLDIRQINEIMLRLFNRFLYTLRSQALSKKMVRCSLEPYQ
ncbi:hypothetical protein ACLOJK_025641 [Asimina triloba]